MRDQESEGARFLNDLSLVQGTLLISIRMTQGQRDEASGGNRSFYCISRYRYNIDIVIGTILMSLFALIFDVTEWYRMVINILAYAPSYITLR